MESKSLPQWSHHYGRKGEYVSAEWTGAEKKIKSPLRLGLGTINIAPLWKD